MIATILALPRWLKLAGIGALIVVAVFTLHRCAIRDAIKDHDAQQEAAAADAREEAATERQADAIENAIKEDARNDAIDQATDSAPGDADLRLNCARLRALGRIPEPCRGFSDN